MELANFDRETAIHTETATMTIIPLTTIEVLPLAMLATSGEILSHEFVTPKPTPKRLRKKNCGLSCETYPVAPASHVGARLLQEFEGYGCFFGGENTGSDDLVNPVRGHDRRRSFLGLFQFFVYYGGSPWAVER